MNIKSIITTIAICLFLFGNAQDIVDITGQVKTKSNGENIEFCSIVLLNNRDSIITGGITDSKGFFNISVIKSYYKLVLSFVGYKTDTIRLDYVYDNKYIGTVYLESVTNTLNDVVVLGHITHQTIDKEITIVTDSLTSNTESAGELLDKLNGISVDRFDNSISVDNSKKTLILVNGTEKNQEYVKNISPNRILRVEIVRNPVGRYALEGYEAIINLIIKPNYVGSELYLKNKSVIDCDAPKRISLIPINDIFGAYSFTYNKFNFYINFSNYYKDFTLKQVSYKENNNLVIESDKAYIDEPNFSVIENTTDYVFGIDYHINPKITVSYEGGLANFPKGKNTKEMINHYVVLEQDSLVDNYRQTSNYNDKTTNSYHSIFLIGDYGKNQVKADASLSLYDNQYNSINYINDLVFVESKGTDERIFSSFNFYYARVFENRIQIETGYGYKNKKVLSYTGLIGSLNDKFSQSNNINNIFIFLSHNLNNKLSYKIGSALELNVQNSSYQYQNYLILQPFVNVNYDFTNKTKISFKYEAKSNYPTTNETTPFFRIIDNNTLFKGNPELTPSLLHTISFKSSFAKNKLTFEPHVGYSNNRLIQNGYVLNDSIFVIESENIPCFLNYGLLSNASFPIGKSLYFESTVDLYQTKISFGRAERTMFNWSVSSQLMYYNSSGFVSGLIYQKNTNKEMSLIGYIQNNNDYWMLLIKKPFFNKRLSVMLAYILPIDFAVDNAIDNIKELGTYVDHSTLDVSVLKNMLVFEVSYRFNKGRTIKEITKELQNDYENKNIRNSLF